MKKSCINCQDVNYCYAPGCAPSDYSCGDWYPRNGQCPKLYGESATHAITNFDAIKSMSVEEFAAFINQIRESCFLERTCTNCPLYDGKYAHCGNTLEEWLEEVAE